MRDTYLAAVSLFRVSNIAAVTSCMCFNLASVHAQAHLGEEGLVMKVLTESSPAPVEQECLILIFPFRAELVIGGFVVKEISSDPPKCLVTYITRVDLKGEWFLRPSCSKLAT